MSPAPWEAADALPPKPPGPDFGFIAGRRIYACAPEDLERAVREAKPAPFLVWTPETARLVTPWEVPWLEGAMVHRSLGALRGRARLSMLLLVLLGGLAALNAGSPWFPVYAALAFFMGLVPLLTVGRMIRRLRSGRINAAGTARLTRFVQWTRRGASGASWFIAACLAGAALWQLSVGLNASVLLVGHVKPLAANGEPWRFLTGGLVHGGVLHFTLNAMALLTLGRMAQALTSRHHVVLVFLVSVLTGSLASQWIDPTEISVGSSGGILGLLGFLMLFDRSRPGVLPRQIRSWFLAMLAGVAALGAAAPRLVDNAAHAGGFLGGALVGTLLLFRRRDEVPARARAGLSLLGWLAAAILALATLALPLASPSQRLVEWLQESSE